MISFTWVSEVPGSSTGIKRRLPSLRGGMNSLPMPLPRRATEGQPADSSRVTQVRGSPKARMIASPKIRPAEVRTVLRQMSACDKRGS